MTRSKSLADVLLRDLQNPGGLTPLFGIDARAGVVVERLETERRLAGRALQNIAALVACMEAAFDENATGQSSKEVLISELWTTLQVMKRQLEYDEAAALCQSRE